MLTLTKNRSWSGRARDRFAAAIGITLFALAAFTGQSSGQIYTLPRVDARNGDFFGESVSISGDRVLVGSTGADTCGENSGAAYLYERDPDSGHWRLDATLTPSDCDAGRFFGRSLSLDASTAVVGAFNNAVAATGSNAAYVFERDSTNGSWTQVARLTGNPQDEEGPFAAHVAIDDKRILVTTAGDLAEGRFGGAAYVFERDGGRWQQTARLRASANTRLGVLGGPADLDGDRIAVSASRYFQGGSGSVYIFDYDDTRHRWTESARLDGFEDFFISTDVDDDRIIVGEGKAGRESDGRATIFSLSESGGWTREAVLRPTHPFALGAFGSKVVIGGDRAIVVGYDEQLQQDFNIDRVAYVFEAERQGMTLLPVWRQKHVIDIGSVYFGSSLDLDGNVAAIGQSSENTAGAVMIVILH